ncbi:MAG: hypothetical protein EBR02_01740 [Alphaproteobacteria bacterium]|nr:hypothetical protein [Alphaproteobacteria bacterium]
MNHEVASGVRAEKQPRPKAVPITTHDIRVVAANALPLYIVLLLQVFLGYFYLPANPKKHIHRFFALFLHFLQISA